MHSSIAAALAGLLLIILPDLTSAQRVIEQYQPVEGYLRIGPEPRRAIPLTERGHTLILPAGAATPTGVTVFLDPRRFESASFTPEPGSFHAEALARSMGVLHVTTGNPLDFFFDEATLRDVAERLQAVLESQDLGQLPVYFAGLSLGGTRVLKLAVYLRKHRDLYWIGPTAVAIVDAPLDMVRLWDAERRAAEADFHPAAADEGRWVAYLLETHLGGPPEESFDRYVTYSPFVYDAPDGGNAIYLRDLPLRAYHEPDVDWWIENRRKSYYSMNSLDQAALVNELRLQGNDRAELITTYRRREGFAEGSSPHTWSFVDNAELVDWFLAQASQ